MKILKYPSKALLIKTELVNIAHFNPSSEKLFAEKYTPKIMEMLETLEGTPNAYALAANQVDLPWRLFCLKESLADELNTPTVIINPSLEVIGSKRETQDEGCLSFPDLYYKVNRPSKVSCHYYTMTGEKKFKDLSGIGARVFQHECEHLDGNIFINNLSRIQKFQAIGIMNKRR